MAAVRALLAALLVGCVLAADSFYDLSAVDINGKNVSLSAYRGKDYPQLQELFGKYNSSNFTVLAFPCNQFGDQEPGSNANISASMRKAYNVTFPMFAKSNVNGACTSTDPQACLPPSTICCPANDVVFEYLKSKLPGPILWNFAKFLVNKQGTPVQRAGSGEAPLTLEDAIRKLLNE